MFDRLPHVLSTAAMREADRRTIELFGIPGFTLMESAGRRAAEVAYSMLETPRAGRVVCLCGKGNNGGDGFVIARVLQQAGVKVDVCLVGNPDDLTADSAANRMLAVQIAEHEQGFGLVLYRDRRTLSRLEGADLYVDALLGTGLSSNVREPVSEIISWLNSLDTRVLAVDVPSGLASDSGKTLGAVVRATRTVTMGAYKSGLLVGDGPDVCGPITVAEIGIPRFILDELARSEGSGRFCRPEYIRSLLPHRDRRSHKYASGPTVIFGGSPDFPGAPVLAANAASRIGSGYVVAVCPPEIGHLLSRKLTEVPVIAWLTINGAMDIEGTLARIGNRWTKARSVLIGPGLGRDEGAAGLVKGLLERSERAVVDADGLFALIGEREFVRSRSSGQWVFTPHEGEFTKLYETEDSGENRVRAAQQFSREWNVVLLLKGMPSLTAAPDGRTLINDTGNPAAATAGTGDVLAGMVAGLQAQGLDSFEAAAAAIHLGGAIADTYAASRAPESMIASDVLFLIPDVLADSY